MIEINNIEPDFLKEFSCIGDRCRNNCCSHFWKISIDKNTYKKYKNIRTPKEIVRKFRNGFIKREDNPTNDSNYGYIVQEINQDEPWKPSCKFNVDGLCEIHGKLGEDYLCNTCKIYPRVSVVITENKTIEKGINFSCEAVLNILYDKTTPIMFENYTETVNKNQLKEIYKSSNALIKLEENPIGKHYYYLKMIGIAILQNRDYKVEDRLIHLALLCYKIDEAIKNKQTDNVEEICNTFISGLENGLLDKLLEVKPSYSLQLVKTFNLIKEFIKDKELDPQFMDIINKNINIKDGIQEENYVNYVNNFNEFMKDKQHFLENIIVTQFHNLTMPITTRNIIEDINAFTQYYQMLRCFVAIYMGERKELPETELVDIIAYFGKIIMHKTEKHKIINNYLKENNINDLANLIIMTKS